MYCNLSAYTEYLYQKKELPNNQVPRTVGLIQIVFIYLRPFTKTSPICSPECHVMKPMKGQGLFKWHFDGICVPPLTFRWLSFFYLD